MFLKYMATQYYTPNAFMWLYIAPGAHSGAPDQYNLYVSAK